MLTYQQARQYHPNQRGIHQRRGQIISICASFSGSDRKYHDELLAEDLMIYIGEGELTQPQADTPGNVALKQAKYTGAIFDAVARWGRNQYEYLGKWRVLDWEYSASDKYPPHYRFLLQRVQAPTEPASQARHFLEAHPPRRTTAAVTRVIRDTEVVRQLKSLYSHTCQICQQPLNRGFGDPLVEGHHIKPLGRPHDGPDIPENVIIVCPNHHALFDFGAITIDLQQRRVIHVDPGDTLNGAALVLRHEIGEEYVRYHNEHIFRGHI